MKDLEEFCAVTIVGKDDGRIRAHKLVLASASYTFRDLLQSDFEVSDIKINRGFGESCKQW